MAIQWQLRKGTTAQHATFTGAVAEVTVDTDKDTLVVHDGTTVGGHALAKESAVTTHVMDTNNPHNVTKAQVGLGNVPNVNTTNPSNITQSANYRFVTDTEKSTWNAKQNAITGAATTITSSNLTSDRALISNSSGKIEASAVTSTELGYIKGVTSGVQTQLNAKAPLTGAGASGTWGISVTGNAGTVTNGVYTTGNQTIAGVKTFSSNPLSTATQSTNANALTKYSAVVKNTGDETIGGVKTFSSNPLSTATQSTAVNALTRKDYVDSLNTSNVKLTGDQTIAGVKTFSSTISGSINGNAGTATKLATARTITLSGGATGTATSFDGTGNISIPVTGLNASNLNTGTVPDARLSGIYSGMSLKLNGNNTVFTTESSGSANTSRTVYGLAEYKSNGSSTTGAIVFIAPSSPSAIMHQLEVSGLLYNQNIVSLIVQGYRTTGTWSDLRKISTGTVDIQVRWGVTPEGKNCLILGDVDTVWSYPHIAITRAMFSYSGLSDDYCIGWTTALVTSFTGYTNISATIGDSTMIGNVSSATKLQTARLIGGVSFDGTANINLPGVNTAGNQNTTGNAATVTNGVYTTGDQTINGVKTFSSSPIVPTPTAGDNSTKVATTAFVAGAISAGGYVATTGNQTIAGVKTFSSSPIVPTPTDGTQVANKAYVDTKQANLGYIPVQQGTGIGQSGNTVKIGWSSEGRLKATVDVTDIGNIVTDIAGTIAGVKTFSSSPIVPTPTAGDNSTKVATTAFVAGATGSIQTQLNAKAPLNSPAFTGTPTVPTPTAGDNSTKVATTAFVAGAISAVGAGLQNSQIFTASGTWTCPVGVTKVIVGICGGGGGGGGIANGSYLGCGGGGGSLMRYFTVSVTPGTNYTITVGAGGAGGSSGGDGGNGGTSSFGTILSVLGGEGADGSNKAFSGTFGGAGSYTPRYIPVLINEYVTSEPGEPTVYLVSNGVAKRGNFGGAGGLGGKYSTGFGTSRTTVGPGNSATGIGCGGGGAYTSATFPAYAGGAGYRGQVEIYW